jgi:anaerobic selenocysteine-containing dehydrogenase
LGVPVTKLYDRARSVSSAVLLEKRIGEAFVALHPSAAQTLGVSAGDRATISLDGTSQDVVVRTDESIGAGVALIPRSMGLPIAEPTPIRLRGNRKAGS